VLHCRRLLRQKSVNRAKQLGYDVSSGDIEPLDLTDLTVQEQEEIMTIIESERAAFQVKLARSKERVVSGTRCSQLVCAPSIRLPVRMWVSMLVASVVRPNLTCVLSSRLAGIAQRVHCSGKAHAHGSAARA
jgi:hypothetical protein